MKIRLAFLFLLAALLWPLAVCSPARAQTVCGGVNFVPAPGVNCLLEPGAPSYGATSVALVPAASATDVACISGAAGKVIRVQYIVVSGSAGTLITIPVLITKHVSLNTGGTPATGTALPVPYALDSNDAAAVASTTAWTGNPTIVDSAPGIIDSGELSLNTTSALVGAPPLKFDYQERNFIKAPILRSAVQQLCVNLNTTSITSGSIQITFRWTELGS